MQGPGIGTRGQEHLEEDVHRVRRREDDERRPLEVVDRVAHPVIDGQAPDLDGWYLDD